MEQEGLLRAAQTRLQSQGQRGYRGYGSYTSFSHVNE